MLKCKQFRHIKAHKTMVKTTPFPLQILSKLAPLVWTLKGYYLYLSTPGAGCGTQPQVGGAGFFV